MAKLKEQIIIPWTVAKEAIKKGKEKQKITEEEIEPATKENNQAELVWSANQEAYITTEQYYQEEVIKIHQHPSLFKN